VTTTPTSRVVLSCDEHIPLLPRPGQQEKRSDDAVGLGLVVRDARDGAERRRFEVPRSVRAAGWESPDTVLYTSIDDDGTVVVRCQISSGRCRDAVAYTDGYLSRSLLPDEPSTSE
jgi:hypothetical protein